MKLIDKDAKAPTEESLVPVYPWEAAQAMLASGAFIHVAPEGERGPDMPVTQTPSLGTKPLGMADDEDDEPVDGQLHHVANYLIPGEPAGVAVIEPPSGPKSFSGEVEVPAKTLTKKAEPPKSTQVDSKPPVSAPASKVDGGAQA